MNKITRTKLKRTPIFESNEMTVDTQASQSTIVLLSRWPIAFAVFFTLVCWECSYKRTLHWFYELILYNKRWLKLGANPAAWAMNLMLIVILSLTQEVFQVNVVLFWLQLKWTKVLSHGFVGPPSLWGGLNVKRKLTNRRRFFVSVDETQASGSAVNSSVISVHISPRAQV